MQTASKTPYGSIQMEPLMAGEKTPTSVPHYQLDVEHRPAKDFMVWSWLNFLFNPCSLFCSIPALIASYLTEVYNKHRYPDDARKKSNLALWCNIIALIWFLLILIVAIVVGIKFAIAIRAIFGAIYGYRDFEGNTTSAAGGKG